MNKEDLLFEIEKLEEELKISNKKTYIINSRLKRLIIFLKNYNNEIESDEMDNLIDRITFCEEKGGYGEKGEYDKIQYLEVLKETKDMLK